MQDFSENETYVLTASRTRASWQEPVGNSMVVRSRRFRRGDKLDGIPADQIARLVEMGHAVPESEYDPAKIQKLSAARRLAMTQAAAADARAAINNSRESHGQPVVGLEDADPAETQEHGTELDRSGGTENQSPRVYSGHEADGIPVEDVVDMKSSDEDPDDQDGPQPGSDEDMTVPENNAASNEDYASMDYPTLQNLAKTRTGNGGGSKEDLIARLREHDAQNQ